MNVLSFRARMALRRLPRRTRRLLALDVAAAPPAAATPPAPMAPPEPAARPPRRINLSAAPSGMEQRAARWRGK